LVFGGLTLPTKGILLFLFFFTEPPAFPDSDTHVLLGGIEFVSERPERRVVSEGTLDLYKLLTCYV
jgi:hypothetical protein